MTIIPYTGTEIKEHNDIKLAVRNNSPCADILHVVAVVSNPCQYKRRFKLANQFIDRMRQEDHVKLHLVELAYGNQPFALRGATQLRTDADPIWVKESLINYAIKNLLPPDWKAVAWIDADIEFDSHSWALDTLKILHGSKDIVQLFSHAIDMDSHEDSMKIFSGFGFSYAKHRPYEIGKWHPGFAWACTRRCFEQMGGLYDVSILGAGDHNMAFSLVGQGHMSVNQHVSNGYMQSITEYTDRCKGLRIGYVPGVIRHYFHGTKLKRGYNTRWKILVDSKYDPSCDIERDDNGIIQLKTTRKELAKEIMSYFMSRDEDEFFCTIVNKK